MPGWRMAPATMVVAVGLAAAGCSTTVPRSVDEVAVERQIVQAQQSSAKGLSVGAATCPASEPATVATRFTCTIAVDGVTVEYTVEVNSLAGGKVHFTFEPTHPIIDAETVAAAIAKNLSSAATVDCGRRVQQLAAGATLTCTAVDHGQRGTVAFTVGSDGTLTPVTTTPPSGSGGGSTSTVPGGI